MDREARNRLAETANTCLHRHGRLWRPCRARVLISWVGGYLALATRLRYWNLLSLDLRLQKHFPRLPKISALILSPYRNYTKKLSVEIWDVETGRLGDFNRFGQIKLPMQTDFQ